MTSHNKKSTVKKIGTIFLIGFSTLVFLAYWGITCLFNFPESSIVIGENYRGYKAFNAILYQRWNFFAPPPTYNLRMHYIFTTPNTLHDVEVFKNINQKVQEKYLTNDMYANISWMLFSNTDAVINFMAKYQRLLMDREKCNTSDSLCTGKQYMVARDEAQKSMSMNLILNHAKKLAKQLKLDPDYKLRIIISTVDIPKYNERNKKRIKDKENRIFVSSIYNPNKNEWIR